MFYVIDHTDLERIIAARDRGEVDCAWQEVGLIYGPKSQDAAKAYHDAGGVINAIIETPERKKQLMERIES